MQQYSTLLLNSSSLKYENIMGSAPLHEHAGASLDLFQYDRKGS